MPAADQAEQQRNVDVPDAGGERYHRHRAFFHSPQLIVGVHRDVGQQVSAAFVHGHLEGDYHGRSRQERPVKADGRAVRDGQGSVVVADKRTNRAVHVFHADGAGGCCEQTGGDVVVSKNNLVRARIIIRLQEVPDFHIQGLGRICYQLHIIVLNCGKRCTISNQRNAVVVSCVVLNNKVIPEKTHEVIRFCCIWNRGICC